MYQSLVALEDCPEEVGGFYNTPGCIPFLKTWVSERRIPHRKWVSHRIPVDDPMVKYLQKVALRKGTERGRKKVKERLTHYPIVGEMVIFNTGQMHCNFPNTSNKCRLFQFIRMLPATIESQNKDRYAPRRIMAEKMYRHIDLNATVQLTPLGRKLVGLDAWEDDGEATKEKEKETEKEKEDM